MLKRVLFGLLKGAVVGGALGALIVFGLGMPVVAAWLAYLGAVLTGALTGLVAGRPIWAKGARIEAGLKAAAGAVVAAIGMFAVRKWLNVSLELGALGKGLVGDLPIVSLPLVASLLGLFFEVDNTGDDGEPEEKQRVEADKLRVSELEEPSEELEDQDEAASRRARRD